MQGVFTQSCYEYQLLLSRPVNRGLLYLCPMHYLEMTVFTEVTVLRDNRPSTSWFYLRVPLCSSPKTRPSFVLCDKTFIKFPQNPFVLIPSFDRWYAKAGC